MVNTQYRCTNLRAEIEGPRKNTIELILRLLERLWLWLTEWHRSHWSSVLLELPANLLCRLMGKIYSCEMSCQRYSTTKPSKGSAGESCWPLCAAHQHALQRLSAGEAVCTMSKKPEPERKISSLLQCFTMSSASKVQIYVN